MFAIQTLAAILLALLVSLVGLMSGLSFLVGGGIATLAQAYYNIRAGKNLSGASAAQAIFDMAVGTAGKWLIFICLSLVSVKSISEYIQAGSLYAGLFVVYLLGVFLLPILVKTSLKK